MKASGKNIRSCALSESPSYLLEQMRDRSPLVRIKALESITDIEYPYALDALIRGLSDKSSDVRVTAAEILGRLRSKKGVAPLLTGLADSNSEVRMRAAESLGLIVEDGKCPRALLKVLKDADELVRTNAAEALGMIGDRKALPALRKAVNDPSPLVRSYVAEAIGKLGDVRDIGRLNEELKKEISERVKVGLYQALHILGQRDALQNLLTLIESSDYRVRCATANTLSAIHIDRADTPLILRTLRKALRKEPTVAARSSIRSSLRAISQ